MTELVTVVVIDVVCVVVAVLVGVVDVVILVLGVELAEVVWLLVAVVEPHALYVLSCTSAIMLFKNGTISHSNWLFMFGTTSTPELMHPNELISPDSDGNDCKSSVFTASAAAVH